MRCSGRCSAWAQRRWHGRHRERPLVLRRLVGRGSAVRFALFELIQQGRILCPNRLEFRPQRGGGHRCECFLLLRHESPKHVDTGGLCSSGVRRRNRRERNHDERAAHHCPRFLVEVEVESAAEECRYM